MQRSLAPSVMLRDKAVDSALRLLTSPNCPDQVLLISASCPYDLFVLNWVDMHQ
jgi:hypothetical protein